MSRIKKTGESLKDGVTRTRGMHRWTVGVLLLAIGAGAGAGYSLVTAHPRRERGRHHARRTDSTRRVRHAWPARAAPNLDAAVASVDASVSVSVPRVAVAPTPLRRIASEGRSAQACPTLIRSDRDGKWVSRDDVHPPIGFVDGDDLLTIVNRSPRFVLSPDYVPRDLVELDTGQPVGPERCEPSREHCLRAEAAAALHLMLNAMAQQGFPGHVHSAFRSYETQCGVFRKWSYGQGQGFCHATTSSAIAGHSQHQLGTAVDLFTKDWARNENVMRPGFGCTPGGRWLADHSWEFGYVLPYPMPLDQRAAGSNCRRREGGDDVIDARTGYRYEPWHLRYIGVDAAVRFHTAWVESEPGTAREITLEQWLRRERGIDADADLAVCDGCSCSLCATFHDGRPAITETRRHATEAPRTTGPCGDRALLLDANGEPVEPASAPRIDMAHARREYMGVRVLVTLSVPAHVVTQPPVTSRYTGVYGPDMSWSSVRPIERPGVLARSYPDLRGTWRLALAPRGNDTWPWRAALRSAATPSWVNGANMRLPTTQGITTIEVVVPPIGDVVRIALMRDGVVRGDVVEAPIR